MSRNALTKARNEIDRLRRSASLARREAKEAPMKVAVSSTVANSTAATVRGALRGALPAAANPMADAAIAGLLVGAGWATGNASLLFAAHAFSAPAISDMVETQVSRFMSGE